MGHWEIPTLLRRNRVQPCAKAHMKMLLLTFHLQCSVKTMVLLSEDNHFSTAKPALLHYSLFTACNFPTKLS